MICKIRHSAIAAAVIMVSWQHLWSLLFQWFSILVKFAYYLLENMEYDIAMSICTILFCSWGAFSQVHCDHVREVAHIIRAALENAVSLSVQLPVKMKVGETWGSLKEIML